MDDAKMQGFARRLMSKQLLLTVTATLLLGLSHMGVAEQVYVDSAEESVIKEQIEKAMANRAGQ